MMRIPEFRILISWIGRRMLAPARTLAVLACVLWAGSAWAGTFGKVVPIGGHASDIALDEARGVLYVANYSANRVEVMDLATNTVPRSINVTLPNSLTLSPDGQFLVVSTYGNFASPGQAVNGLTVINLNNNTKQNYSLGSAPLAVAFGADGQCLVVTSTDLALFDPQSGLLQVISSFQALASKTLPQTGPAFPPNITESAIGVSRDGLKIYGTTEALGFIWDVERHEILGFPTKGAEPPLGPRSVSVSDDGSYFAFGWAVWDARGRFVADFPNVTGDFNVGSYVVDSASNTIYAQIPEAIPVGPAGPVLQVLDADNLSIREYLKLPENLAGRSLLTLDRQTVYAISDSGVTILPVGALNQQKRLSVNYEDLVFRGNFCDHAATAQELVISDPGGGHTDFSLSTTTTGVTISPESGVTPAVIHVTVDPTTFQNQKGTTIAQIDIASTGAVNVPTPVRLLINNREPDQRGSFVSVPGKLVDILADPGRDRFYVLRQDKGQVLVFNGSNNTQIATLRTNAGPTQMAITRDARYLLVAHDRAWNINVYDLESLEPRAPIRMPYAHYPLQVAVSNRAILAVSDNRQVGKGYNTIDRVDFASRTAQEMPSLGPWENKFESFVGLTSSPNGASIFAASADGRTLVYSANADTFTVYRQDFEKLSGAMGASNTDQYVVDNHLLNASLVQTRTLDSAGTSSGFAFADDLGLFSSTPDATAPGVITRVNLSTGSEIRPTRVVESPLTPAADDSNLKERINPFTHTLAPLLSRNVIISLTQSGFTVLPWNYDAAVAIPQLSRVVNSADHEKPVAPGGLITVEGTDLSPVNLATTQIPLPTALGDSCLTVNGTIIPLVFVSSTQINAQLPFDVDGNAQMVLRTPGGVSDNLNFTISANAPAVFRTGVAGPDSDIPVVVRAVNNTIVTLSNPVHKGDDLTIYATGLGRTNPIVDAGLPGPSDDLALAVVEPSVFLGNVGLPVTYAGLAPGQVGVYQINVKVPSTVPSGLQVVMTIVQGNGKTSLAVRVVE
jgi:uncharacterized protein (TIGR03437 family)